MCTKLVFKYFRVAISVRELLQEDMNCSYVLLVAPTIDMEALNATCVPKSLSIDLLALAITS